jgi:hypothetical protein
MTQNTKIPLPYRPKYQNTTERATFSPVAVLGAPYRYRQKRLFGEYLRLGLPKIVNVNTYVVRFNEGSKNVKQMGSRTATYWSKIDHTHKIVASNLRYYTSANEYRGISNTAFIKVSNQKPIISFPKPLSVNDPNVPNVRRRRCAQYRNTANTAEIPKYHSQNRQHTEIPKYRNTGVGVHTIVEWRR